ncbi:MAG: agmatine deiminase family protein, partial [Pirellulales bacterium]|nr:agmatine deiminase family protein [Pirellulales bacterium]
MYCLPAEWSPHAATWLAWPHNRETWPGKFEPIPGLFTELIKAIARFEPVHVLCGGKGASSRPLADEARELLGDSLTDSRFAITLHADIPTNDAWVRDYGPMFVRGPAGSPLWLISWGYNAWGRKYPPFDADNRVPSLIAEKLSMTEIKPGIVLEGGAIDTNGQGVFLVGERCLLDPRRNSDFSKSAAEDALSQHCGAEEVIWLPGEIAGDDTDGHADQVARFVSPGAILAAVEGDRRDENYEPLQRNLRVLQHARDQ